MKTNSPLAQENTVDLFTKQQSPRFLFPAWVCRATTGLSLFCLLFMGSCTQQQRETKRSIEPTDLRPASGVTLEVDDPQQLRKLADALDAMTLGKPKSPPAARPTTATPEEINAAQALAMAKPANVPADSIALFTLPKLSATEIGEISERLEMRLAAQQGYLPASATVEDMLPLPPAGLTRGSTLARMVEQNTHVVRFAIRHYVSMPPQFWAMGVIIDPSGSLAKNPDLAGIEPAVKEMVKALEEMRKGLTVEDMEAKLIQLSYTDAKTALTMLKGMGMTTIDDPSKIPPKAEFAKLPYIVKVPDPDKADTGLIGAKTTAKGVGGLSLSPGVASELTPNTVASPMTQLMVMFHRAHPGQFSKVRKALDTYIDRPARQIFIEAMVLEISEDGLKDLGIDWSVTEGPLDLLDIKHLGALNAGATTSALDITINDLSELDDVWKGTSEWDWTIKIRALVRTGKAEILSRPSVLTLNNRQSTIRVGQDLPIASSLEGLYGSSNKISFSFKYLPTGILLNIRPRINEDGSEVSMLIDTIVSAEVPGADLELRGGDNDQVLAKAPTVSTRRVQTYGRIRNNTPFIIGGLVASQKIVTEDKVPLLGDIPLLGALFRAKKTENEKREVIIVLTPYVLPEKKLIPRSLPKDEDLFDSFGHELFRDSYRIRSEDVFDLSFLLENPRLVKYRLQARQVVDKNFRLGQNEPFRSFVRDSIPGESILVTRMIYEVIKRLDLANTVMPERIIYLKSQQVGGYNVGFLEPYLEELGSQPFEDLGDKALAIVFTDKPVLGDKVNESGLSNSPLPKISLVDCPDREAWGQRLWELNQPGPDGLQRYAVLIQNQTDLLRLRRALALKKIMALNGGEEQMRLRNFSVGKVLLMPELKSDQIHLLELEAAKLFFHTEHYYGATLREIETQLTEIDTKLQKPEIRALLEADIQETKPESTSK